MVMRNLKSPKLCNGTRVVIDVLGKHIIVGRILGGAYSGEQVILPRIKLVTSDTAIRFSRFQFPVKLSFAMTINKSQGETLNMCGLMLNKSKCFSDGQLSPVPE